MSRPFAAKGVGVRARTYSQHPAPLPAPPRMQRGDEIDAIRAYDRRLAPNDMRSSLGTARVPLDEGDPLPPVEDRSVPTTYLEDIYRAERPRLLRFLDRRTAGDRAEDVVQQVFTRLLARSRTEAVTLEAPRAYLRQAAQNLLCDEARNAHRTYQAQHVPIEDVEVEDADPVAALEARDRLERIEQAVMRLKPLTRQIFLACRLDGYSYAEIAEQTGLSVRGVEKQMSRAIKQLGRHLHNHD